MKKDADSQHQSQPRSLRGRGPHLLTQLLRRYRCRTGVRLTSFGMVGATGLLVNSLLLAVFTDLVGLHYLFSAIVATQGSSAWNFWLCETWVFRDRETGKSRLPRAIRFLIMNNLALTARGPILIVLTSGLGLHYLISNVVSILLLGLARYILSDRWIWANGHPKSSAPIAYNIHDLLRIQSPVPLPELEYFRVPDNDQAQDMRLAVESPRSQNGEKPETGAGNNSVISYSQVPGPFGFRIQAHLGDTTEVRVSPLLAASPHVLYTNVVEPLLRWMLVRKGYALVHGACIGSGGRAVLVSALTDTGKTTTILRTLSKHTGTFLSDDMTILSRQGRLLCYPKPLTISRHTLEAVNGAMLSRWQRTALVLQSRVHSRSGRRLALMLAKTRLPMAWVNALVQILIPPPKYTIEELIEGATIAKEARLSHLMFIERGAEAEESLDPKLALEVLLRNCDDAYGFPPYTELAHALLGSYEEDLRQAESDIISEAIAECPASVLRRENRNWWERLLVMCDDLSMAGNSTRSPVTAALPDPQVVSRR